MLYQLSYAPGCPSQCRYVFRRSFAGLAFRAMAFALGVLFLVLTIGLAGVAYAAVADQWVIAFAAGVMAGSRRWRRAA